MQRKQLLFLLALLITAATGAWAQTGMTKGSFSVSATKRVHFSKGNLQLVGENTFQFAENQWDVFGNTQSNGHRDLFGWGTANNPDLISENNNDYSTFTDWGTKIGDGTTWRTLTNDEWNYVLNTRTASTLNGTENARYAYATVNGVGGLILFPDNYTHPGTVAAPAQINTPSNAFNANTYDVHAWDAMEDAGAVFLPHGGCRTGTLHQSNQPNYWSSTPISGTLAYGLNLSGMEFKNWFRFRGCSVRLVTDGYVLKLADGTQDAKNWTIASGDNSVKGDVADGLTGLSEGDAVTLTYGGRMKVKGVTATTDAPAAKKATDLSTINANYTASDGETLTGELASNVKISIADGATVTLDGVTINGVNFTGNEWAGITCEGDATIILSGTNTVKGFYEDYPGIQAAAGKTLIINGTGSLTASSNGYGAGIGGGNNVACGNIEIQGGTITATSVNHGAGIGGGDRASWGNITISGGTVNATGGERGAGIGGGRKGSTGSVSSGNILISGGTVTAIGGENAAGIGGGRGYNSGNFSSCGTITITTGVTKVTATMGDDATNSIGAGYYGTCGTVTIGGTVYWQNNAAVNGGATYLATSPLIYEPSH